MTVTKDRELVSLGSSPLRVSRLGFGCCPMGGHGWGSTDDSEMIDAVRAALELGVRLFDTADIYGLGHSERLLGRALAGRRNEAIVATKFGVRRDARGATYYDNRPDWIVAALDSSLRRLGTDHIDLYQVHYWDGATPLEIICETLSDMREQGKIRYWGVTNMDLIAAGQTTPLQGLVSFSDEYSLAMREAEGSMRAHINRLGLTFLSWGSLGQGILTGKYDATSSLTHGDRRRRSVYVNFHGSRLRKNLELVARLREVAKECPNRTVAQIALRWILDSVPNSVVLTGVKRPAQLDDNLGCLGWQLSDDHRNELDDASAHRVNENGKV